MNLLLPGRNIQSTDGPVEHRKRSLRLIERHHMTGIKDPCEREVPILSGIAVPLSVHHQRRVPRIVEFSRPREVGGQRQILATVPIGDVVCIAVDQGHACTGVEQFDQVGERVRTHEVSREPELGENLGIRTAAVIGVDAQGLLDFADVQVSGEGRRRLRIHAVIADVVLGVFRWGVLEVHKLNRVAAEGACGVADQVINERCAFYVAKTGRGCLAEANVVKASLLHSEGKFHLVCHRVIDFSTMGVVPGEPWQGGRLCLVVNQAVDDGESTEVKMVYLRSVPPFHVEVVLFPEVIHEDRTPMTAV